MDSRFNPGDMTLFQPNLKLVNAATSTTDPLTAVAARVEAVRFTTGKVRYDLALKYVEGEEVIWLPVDNVDSCMVCPFPPVVRNIVINGTKMTTEATTLSYEEVLQLAGLRGNPTTVYSYRNSKDHSGRFLNPGKSVDVWDGLSIDCCHTGNA